MVRSVVAGIETKEFPDDTCNALVRPSKYPTARIDIKHTVIILNRQNPRVDLMLFMHDKWGHGNIQPIIRFGQ